MSKINLILAFIALSLMFVSPGQSSSCRSSKVSNAVQQKTDKVATGIWGGQHVRMQVTESGAQIEYDCGHGTLDEPLALNSEGRLDVKGTYVIERGPVREGGTDGQPARFTGSVEGKTMTLTVTLTKTGKSAGTYTLTQGERGRIIKCQ